MSFSEFLTEGPTWQAVKYHWRMERKRGNRLTNPVVGGIAAASLPVLGGAGVELAHASVPLALGVGAGAAYTAGVALRGHIKDTLRFRRALKGRLMKESKTVSVDHLGRLQRLLGDEYYKLDWDNAVKSKPDKDGYSVQIVPKHRHTLLSTTNEDDRYGQLRQGRILIHHPSGEIVKNGFWMDQPERGWKWRGQDLHKEHFTDYDTRTHKSIWEMLPLKIRLQKEVKQQASAYNSLHDQFEYRKIKK